MASPKDPYPARPARSPIVCTRRGWSLRSLARRRWRHISCRPAMGRTFRKSRAGLTPALLGPCGRFTTGRTVLCGPNTRPSPRTPRRSRRASTGSYGLALRQTGRITRITHMPCSAAGMNLAAGRWRIWAITACGRCSRSSISMPLSWSNHGPVIFVRSRATFPCGSGTITPFRRPARFGSSSPPRAPGRRWISSGMTARCGLRRRLSWRRITWSCGPRG